MKYNYPAFMFRDDGKITVVFPDLPGCLTFCDNVADAFLAAQEAVEGHLAAMADEGMKIPEPSDLLAVEPEADDAPALVAKVLVPVTLPGRTVRTNITIEEGLLDLIDAVAANRSQFLAEAARNELARRRGR
ncbi:MAG: type II toxin-antitoxin system HicB family antitoxin [Magnetospirillum sp.]|nr:type II toxin-antitoxin system HicB family antitoxin [Magnetospirillum sp.]